MKIKCIDKYDWLGPLMRIAIYTGIFVCFFASMAVFNFWMRQPSRTLAVTLLTFFTMQIAMNAVYGGYAVGKKKSKPVISSMALATLITDCVTYLQFQIMNVNPDNNQHLVLFNRDFVMLLICMVLQVAWIIFWVRLGNNMYFRIRPPATCCVVMGPGVDREVILRKIDRHRLQYQVEWVLPSDSVRLKAGIIACETVFLCGVPETQTNSLLTYCYRHGKNVLCLADLEDIMLSNAKQVILDDVPFLEMEHRRLTMGQQCAKRALDLAISLPALLVLAPVLAICALAIHLHDGGPVIFKQKRATINGEIFEIYKFRTMTVEASNARVQFSAAEADARITRVGRVLRKFRLDELPQLLNVIKGDMSLVGPRPEMLENVERYKRELPAFVYREKMKAGITGYAQIEGKYNTTPQDKLMLDLTYIESYSIWLDIKLIFRTLTVFFKKDSSQGFVAEQPEEKVAQG